MRSHLTVCVNAQFYDMSLSVSTMLLHVLPKGLSDSIVHLKIDGGDSTQD